MTHREAPHRLSGIHAVASLLRENPERIRRLIVQADARPHPARDVLVAEARGLGIEVVERDAGWFRALATGRNAQGIAAEIAPFPYAVLGDVVDATAGAEHALVAVLDSITDPQNLGSILRSAAFFGLAGVIIPKDRAAEVTPTVERVAAGGAAAVRVCQVTNIARTLDALKDAGFWVYGTVASGGEPMHRTDLTGRTALVLGAEGSGLRRLVAEKCDRLVTLPPRGPMPALNAGVFAGVAFFEWARQVEAAAASASTETTP